MTKTDSNPAPNQLPPNKGKPGVTDVISALSHHDGHFAAQEQKVADYVKGHLEEISSMTIGDLAKNCGVSKPTVIRFCRTLGCDGFREFKLRLAQNLAVSIQYLSANPEQSVLGSDTALDQVLGALFATANAMRQQIDTDALDEAKTAILNTRHLLFAGIGGGSSTVAHEASNRFFRLGIPSFAASDSYILQMRAATLGPGDVLFLISASGEADAIVGAAEIAAGYGATTICITKPNTRLANVAKIPIVVDIPEDSDIYKPTASRYAHLTLIDALAMSVAQDMSKETVENLRRIRASLTAYHGRTGPQPLGD
ncbi:MurR/RpiR family transcriptional regulator [Actibacterium lipolyticum]|uniref:Putative HTH-type transcriptional regulator YbbH n=1 Tax=Actibacterium lipolyticum TaxID=1524263 RepID=A0A238JLK1_9RHOB|nr:MurR/RpiR family transcriptional regulator [Actibacterium lipolyticum]SMX31074.1 putative HTH-type transcriptional regulator YbbH [Actibacterium lipolyticum]